MSLFPKIALIYDFHRGIKYYSIKRKLIARFSFQTSAANPLHCALSLASVLAHSKCLVSFHNISLLNLWQPLTGEIKMSKSSRIWFSCSWSVKLREQFPVANAISHWRDLVQGQACTWGMGNPYRFQVSSGHEFLTAYWVISSCFKNLGLSKITKTCNRYNINVLYNKRKPRSINSLYQLCFISYGVSTTFSLT